MDQQQILATKIQMSVTLFVYVAPQTRDSNLHPGYLLPLIRPVQSVVSSPETETLIPIIYHWFSSSVIIKDIWDNRKCFTILENIWQIHKNMTV